MIESILKCSSYKNHQDDVIMFCNKPDCNYKSKFLCMTYITQNENDHLKEQKNCIIDIHNLMKDDNKPLKNFS